MVKKKLTCWICRLWKFVNFNFHFYKYIVFSENSFTLFCSHCKYKQVSINKFTRSNFAYPYKFILSYFPSPINWSHRISLLAINSSHHISFLPINSSHRISFFPMNSFGFMFSIYSKKGIVLLYLVSPHNSHSPSFFSFTDIALFSYWYLNNKQTKPTEIWQDARQRLVYLEDFQEQSHLSCVQIGQSRALPV